MCTHVLWCKLCGTSGTGILLRSLSLLPLREMNSKFIKLCHLNGECLFQFFLHVPNTHPKNVISTVNNATLQFVHDVTADHRDLIEHPGLRSPPLDRPLLAQPKFLSGTITRCYCLYRAMCVSDKRMRTIGNSSITKLYNIQGELLDSIKMKSWNVPLNIPFQWVNI